MTNNHSKIRFLTIFQLPDLFICHIKDTIRVLHIPRTQDVSYHNFSSVIIFRQPKAMHIQAPIYYLKGFHGLCEVRSAYVHGVTSPEQQVGVAEASREFLSGTAPLAPSFPTLTNTHIRQWITPSSAGSSEQRDFSLSNVLDPGTASFCCKTIKKANIYEAANAEVWIL